jgi:branched-chain amino acid transport system permease protein
VPAIARLLPRRRQAIPPPAAALPRRVQPAEGETLLEVAAAERRFGGLLAVNDVSFAVMAGEILGLIGPNGAGKSTMFNLITGILGVTSGKISFLGETISTKTGREIARLGVGRTFQHVKLVPTMTVLENAAVGGYLRHRSGLFTTMLRLNRRREAQALAEAAYQLKRVGLLSFQSELASSLSLGQQRILEIARALAGNPILLLLDEPAAGLRANEKQQLGELLIQLRAEGMTILLVEHDMAFIRQVADRVVVVQYGEKLTEGSVTDMQQNQKVREAYLGVD